MDRAGWLSVVLLISLACFGSALDVRTNSAGRRYMCPAKTSRSDCLYDKTCAWWNLVDNDSGDRCVTWSDGGSQPFGSCEAYKAYMQKNVFNCLGCGPSTVVECP
mmetsp:Transcript_139244/g.445073  ORF Transcript_139244/g.445073 Transcript_139244/m.445073 type:complete len:105 (-) Transcript_139244:151-465(-)